MVTAHPLGRPPAWCQAVRRAFGLTQEGRHPENVHGGGCIDHRAEDAQATDGTLARNPRHLRFLPVPVRRSNAPDALSAGSKVGRLDEDLWAAILGLEHRPNLEIPHYREWRPKGAAAAPGRSKSIGCPRTGEHGRLHVRMFLMPPLAGAAPPGLGPDCRPNTIHWQSLAWTTLFASADLRTLLVIDVLRRHHHAGSRHLPPAP